MKYSSNPINRRGTSVDQFDLVKSDINLRYTDLSLTLLGKQAEQIINYVQLNSESLAQSLLKGDKITISNLDINCKMEETKLTIIIPSLIVLYFEMFSSKLV